MGEDELGAAQQLPPSWSGNWKEKKKNCLDTSKTKRNVMVGGRGMVGLGGWKWGPSGQNVWGQNVGECKGCGSVG